MAEALGIASAIASLVTIVGQIAKLSYGFLNDVRNASKLQKAYLQEVSALTGVLLRFDQIFEVADSYNYLTIRPSSNSVNILNNCQDDLNSLKEKLERRSKGDGRMERLKWAFAWPFEEKGIKTHINILHKYRDIFSDALTADAFALSSATFHKVDSLTYNQEALQITEWLSYPEPPRSPGVDSACPGTFQWALKSNEYRSWRDGPLSLIWCYGKPGVSKTVLSSILTDDLLSYRNGGDANVLYYYCESAERESQSTIVVIRNLLQQLLQNRDPMHLPLLQQYRQKSNSPPRLKDLTKAFLGVCSALQGSFLVVDGLDELEDRKDLLPILILASSTGLKVLVTSRDVPDIRHSLQI